VVIAETQTKGKGRLGRKWFSPRGGLWMSIVLKPHLPPREVPLLNLVCSLTIARVLSELGVRAAPKWPNDVVVGSKKVAGILAEADFNGYTNWVVVGIGIDTNVDIDSFPVDVRRRATSLRRELGQEIDHDSLTIRILTGLELDYGKLKEGDFDELVSEWKLKSDIMGKKVKIGLQNESFVGVAVDIGMGGSLLIQMENGDTREATVGEFSLIE
jgi:BirA family biotin operon repressor/biotin-[acetyl-CoA-carboxylase] ligase